MAQTKVKLISDGVIVQGNLHASHGITTAHIGEGSNLYYTDARVGSYLSTNSFATESYVGTQIANLVDSSPSALNTLNELAAALGDDANFSTTVTNSIALKAPLASPSFTGNATFGGDLSVTGGDLTLGTDAIASNINAVGDVLGINVDSNTGGGASANIQLKTAGTTQLTINSSSATFAGQVSVGNYAIPSDHQFQIAHLGQAYARFGLTNSQTGNGSSDGLKFQMENLNSIIKNQENGTLGFGTNGRETDILIDSSGNVGIGETSPGAKLVISGNNDTAGTGVLEIKTTGTNLKIGGNTTYSWIQSHSSKPLYINQLGNNIILNLGGGRVGIGLATPSSKLQFNANNLATSPGTKNYTGSAINTDGGDIATGRVFFQGANSGGVDLCGINNETNRIVLYNYTDNRYLQYWDHAGSSFIPNGNVSIGSTSNGVRGERLFVNGEFRQQSTVGLNPLGATRGGLGAYDNTTGWGAGIGGQLVLGYIYTGSSYTEGALIKMYKQNSTQGHYGSGLRWAVRENGTNLTAKMDLSPSGTLTVIQDIVAYGSPSDKKLKENIKPISLALDKVTKLQGVTFDWKKSDSMLNIKEDIGFIAQDVQKVVPELVRKNSNGLLSMRHQGVVPMLVEAIKELEARVKELENK